MSEIRNICICNAQNRLSVSSDDVSFTSGYERSRWAPVLLLETYTSGVSRRSLCFEFNDAHGRHRWWSSHTDAIRFEVDEELCGRISVAAELQVLVVLEIEIVLLDRSDFFSQGEKISGLELFPSALWRIIFVQRNICAHLGVKSITPSEAWYNGDVWRRMVSKIPEKPSERSISHNHLCAGCLEPLLEGEQLGRQDYYEYIAMPSRSLAKVPICRTPLRPNCEHTHLVWKKPLWITPSNSHKNELIC